MAYENCIWYLILRSLVYLDNIFGIMKKIYIEILNQKYFMIKVDVIQIFIKTFQETDINW